jgi:hypothetical protein
MLDLFEVLQVISAELNGVTVGEQDPLARLTLNEGPESAAVDQQITLRLTVEDAVRSTDIWRGQADVATLRPSDKNSRADQGVNKEEAPLGEEL